MTAVQKVVSYEEKAAPKKLAAEWGWKNPPDEILQLAEKSMHAQNCQSGQILVDWDVIDEETRDRLLKKKQAEIPTLQYFAEQEMRVLQYVEQVLALKNGYPFYDRLSLLSPHKEMGNSQVIKRCEESDAAFMLIENQTPVLVFSSWDAMLEYSLMGQSLKRTDPIIIANGGVVPKLAVGARDDISSVLKLHHAGLDGDDAGDSGGRVWHVKPNDPNSTPEERELARILDHALAEKATDVAFKPLDSGAVEVYIRKWGRLIPPFKRANVESSKRANVESSSDASPKKTTLGSVVASKAINLLQARSGANSEFGRLREPDDGNIKYRSPAANAYMRLNFIPLNHLGEYKNLRSVSVRLFGRTESTRLSDLNIPDEVARYLRDAVQMPQGLILLSGPVNSGKSSTIAGTIGEHVEIYGDSMKRMSVEEPIERDIPGVIQINAPAHIKDPAERFNVVLRALKRHDFNLLFVGEVRDVESADFCVAFASSGHSVLSTIHAKDSIVAFDVLAQMIDKGLRFQLAESFSLSISQRLVKTVCKHCGERDCVPNEEEKRLFALNLEMVGEQREMPERVARAKPGGCNQCDDGYDGALPICEVLPFTRTVKDAVHALLNGEDPRTQRKIIANARPITLLQSGLELVNQGKVDLRSILFF